jgi:hypothetical protein
MWRLGWRRVKFTARLPSDLPGADFVAIIDARWRRGSGTELRGVEPVIRNHLRREAAAVTRGYSACEPDAAGDAVRRRLVISTVKDTGVTVHVQVKVRLDVTQQGRVLAEQRIARARDVQLHQEAEHARLMFLRQKVFADPALGRIWWLQQSPQLLSAANERMLEKAMEESANWVAKTRATLRTPDGLVAILTELADWILRDEQTQRAALDVLDKVLTFLDPPDMQNSRRQLREIRSGMPLVSMNAVDDGSAPRSSPPTPADG